VEDSFDPERLRCVEAPAPANPAARPRMIPRSSHPFVKMPKIWIEVLASIPWATAATYRVALHLIERAWRAPDRKVKLTNAIGVCRPAKYKAIADLRKAGLIVVEERGRKSPIITVRHLA
jgi:hypothetical protein